MKLICVDDSEFDDVIKINKVMKMAKQFLPKAPRYSNRIYQPYYHEEKKKLVIPPCVAAIEFQKGERNLFFDYMKEFDESIKKIRLKARQIFPELEIVTSYSQL